MLESLFNKVLGLKPKIPPPRHIIPLSPLTGILAHISPLKKLSCFEKQLPSKKIFLKIQQSSQENTFMEQIATLIFLETILAIENPIQIRKSTPEFQRIQFRIESQLQNFQTIFSQEKMHPFLHQQHQCFQTGQPKPVEFCSNGINKPLPVPIYSVSGNSFLLLALQTVNRVLT